MPEAAPTVHATAILWGNRALLLRGAAGAGKSRLVLELLAEGCRRGIHTALVGDDRVVLTPAGGRLIVRPAPLLAGRLEVRGLGIVGLAHEPAAVVGLIVDFVQEQPDRLPDHEAGDLVTELVGVVLPRLPLWIEDRAPLFRLLAAVEAFDAAGLVARQNPSRTQFVS